jgi:cobalamin biosynthesis Mg chelatase CobN
VLSWVSVLVHEAVTKFLFFVQNAFEWNNFAARTMSQHDLNALKVEELRNELKKRGLKITGSKAELVARLLNAESSSETSPKRVQAETKPSGTKSPRGRRSSTGQSATSGRHSRKSSTSGSSSSSHGETPKQSSKGDSKVSGSQTSLITTTPGAASSTAAPSTSSTSLFLARRSRRYAAVAVIVVFLFTVLLVFPPVHSTFSPDTLYAIFVFTVLILFTVLDRLEDGQQ